MKTTRVLIGLLCINSTWGALPGMDRIVSGLDSSYGSIQTYEAKADIFQYSG